MFADRKLKVMYFACLWHSKGIHLSKEYGLYYLFDEWDKRKKRWAGDCSVDNNGKTNCGIRSTHKTYEDKQICKWFRTHLCSNPFLGPEAWYFINLPLTGCAHDGYVNTSMVLWMTSTPPRTCPGPRGRGSFLWPVSWTSYFYSVTLTNVPVNQTCYMITRRK